MTNQELRELHPGDEITIRHCGCHAAITRTIETIQQGTCVVNGHAFAMVYSASPSGNGGISYSIESDEYIRAQNYPTHDAQGNRIRGTVKV